MYTVRCELCSGKVLPFCPNPNQVIWMWENEDWEFPFTDTPDHVNEVCSLKPKYSPTSLIKQVQLIQEGKLSSDQGVTANESTQRKFEVQEEVIDRISKIKCLLTNYQQNCGPDWGCGLAKVDEEDSEQNMLDQFLKDSEMAGEQAQIDFSVESEPMFKIEEVCEKTFYNSLHFTGLDSVNEMFSDHTSVVGHNSDVGEDVNMEDEPCSSTESYTNDKNIENTVHNGLKWIESNSTYSKAHSIAW